MVWHDTARHGMAWRGMEMGWRNMAHMEWHGVAWRGMAWRWHGPSRSPSLRTQPPHPTPLPRRPPLCMMPREWRYDMPLATSSRHSSTATCGEGREDGGFEERDRLLPSRFMQQRQPALPASIRPAACDPMYTAGAPAPAPASPCGAAHPCPPAAARPGRLPASRGRSTAAGRWGQGKDARAGGWAAAACSKSISMWPDDQANPKPNPEPKQTRCTRLTSITIQLS